MKIIIGAIVFGLVIISIIVMLVINFTYRSIKKRREEMEDDYYQHLKEKGQGLLQECRSQETTNYKTK